MAKDNGAHTLKSRQGQLSVVPETSVENVLFNSQISPRVESGVLWEGVLVQMTLFGGNGGIATPACGNVRSSFLRNSSNSEYLVHLMSMAKGRFVDDILLPFHNLHGTSLGFISMWGA